MKICNKCNDLKDNFGKKEKSKDGLNPTCKDCLNKQAKIYRINNREIFNKRSNDFYNKSKEGYKLYREENKLILSEKSKKYYENNKERIAEYRNSDKYKDDRNRKRRLNSNKLYRIKNSIRTSIGRSIRMKGYVKNNKTSDILGVDFNGFYIYLESKFEDWMTWDNYGKYNGEFNYGWDIDYIIPIILGITEDDIIKLNHYTNLQPLCSKVNRDIKKDRLEW
jgi:hypothetical protein